MNLLSKLINISSNFLQRTYIFGFTKVFCERQLIPDNRVTKGALWVERFDFSLVKSLNTTFVCQRNLLRLLLHTNHLRFTFLQNNISIIISFRTHNRNLPITKFFILENLAFWSFFEVHQQLKDMITVFFGRFTIFLTKIFTQ